MKGYIRRRLEVLLCNIISVLAGVFVGLGILHMLHCMAHHLS